jgi:hypothetical protein
MRGQTARRKLGKSCPRLQVPQGFGQVLLAKRFRLEA